MENLPTDVFAETAGAATPGSAMEGDLETSIEYDSDEEANALLQGPPGEKFEPKHVYEGSMDRYGHINWIDEYPDEYPDDIRKDDIAEDLNLALVSRIHLSIQYSDLTRNSQKEIWHNLIPHSPGKPTTFTEDDFSAFTEKTMNGREIKNAVKLSHLLARRRKESLMPAHVKDVLAVLYDTEEMERN
ncbi:hypothetical protein F4777DRAFT_575403 [Nemania sp. FL0916]|nr:hypothetical protein F4777DRAFT_575403 [Nemania sp. FL0916]